MDFDRRFKRFRNVLIMLVVLSLIAGTNLQSLASLIGGKNQTDDPEEAVKEVLEENEDEKKTGTSVISGYVWLDVDKDQNEGREKQGIEDITLRLERRDDENGIWEEISEIQTGLNEDIGSGFFAFTGLLEGTYKIHVNLDDEQKLLYMADALLIDGEESNFVVVEEDEEVEVEQLLTTRDEEESEENEVEEDTGESEEDGEEESQGEEESNTRFQPAMGQSVWLDSLDDKEIKLYELSDGIYDGYGVSTFGGGKKIFFEKDNGNGAENYHYTISSNNTSDIVYIEIESGVETAITLDGVTLESSSSATQAPVTVNADATLYLNLKENSDNVVKSNRTGYAGIAVLKGGEIVIDGSGGLEVNGAQNAAGIGGNYNVDVGAVFIKGNVNIEATGGPYGAGIGGGNTKPGNNIQIIENAVVKAIGGSSGAGIGGGYNGAAGYIAITGGVVVNIEGIGVSTGIGGGYNGNGGHIIITDGAEINAEERQIGSSNQAVADGNIEESITISDSTVTAGGITVGQKNGKISITDSNIVSKAVMGAGIGGAPRAVDVEIEISGKCNVQATGASYAAGIGGASSQYSQDGTVKKIKIEDTTDAIETARGDMIIIAIGGADGGAGIGGGREADSGEIIISGGVNVSASGGAYGAAGIGGGGTTYSGYQGGSAEIISIIGDGTIINATGDSYSSSKYGAGIGGGTRGGGGEIKIAGNVKINIGGDEYAAGIGGGCDGNGGNITIADGAEINAEGYQIGSSNVYLVEGSAEDNIEISDAHIIAGGIAVGQTNGKISIKDSFIVSKAVGYRAGIGGVARAKNVKIEILGSCKVEATGGQYGAGIGSGSDSSYIGTVANIYIENITNSMKIEATGGQYGAGIGGGGRANSGDIEIRGDINITAIGNNIYGAAGIGGGGAIYNTQTSTPGGAGENITIDGTGAVITASGGSYNGTRTQGGAGIGGGNYCAGGNINISGDTTVIIKDGMNSTGIGGGRGGGGGKVTFSEGVRLEMNGKPIGSNNGNVMNTEPEHIEITNTIVSNAGGIVVGGTEGTIIITNATIHSKSILGAGIGGVGGAYEVDIQIKGNTWVEASGAYGAAGIGSGADISGNTSARIKKLELNGDLIIKATGGRGGAGIGGGTGNYNLIQDIIVKGKADIQAQGGHSEGVGGGGYAGAGIGSGANGIIKNIFIGDEKEINIAAIGGSSLTYQASGGAAGIGGGTKSNVGAIKITGNTKVTAYGGNGSTYGSGIGLGYTSAPYSGQQYFEKITIEGNAQVKAVGVKNGAGIGGYNNSSPDERATITIGGKAQVEAAAGSAAPGIGGRHVDVVINEDASVEAIGASNGAGIGGWSVDGSVSINGKPYVRAIGGGNGLESVELQKEMLQLVAMLMVTTRSYMPRVVAELQPESVGQTVRRLKQLIS